MTLESDKNVIEVTIDSGAAESVRPQHMSEKYGMRIERAGLIKGFIAANGEYI